MSVQDCLRARGCNNLREPLSNRRQRSLPRHRFELARSFGADTPQWAGEPSVGVTPLSVVADRTFCAEFAAIDWVRRIAPDVRNLVTLLNDHNPTRVIAIAGTGGADMLSDVCHCLPHCYLRALRTG